MVKHFMLDHSRIIVVTKNKRVIVHVVAKRLGEMISTMLFIRLRQLKAMLMKELGVFISKKVCRNVKVLLIKRIGV